MEPKTEKQIDWFDSWIDDGMLIGCLVDRLGDRRLLDAHEKMQLVDHLKEILSLVGGSPLLTAEAAANYLSVPEKFIRNAWRRGALKGVKIGQRYCRFRIADLDDFVERGGK